MGSLVNPLGSPAKAVKAGKAKVSAGAADNAQQDVSTMTDKLESLREANAALEMRVIKLSERLEEKEAQLDEMMEKNAKVRDAFMKANDARKRLQEEKEQLLSGQAPAPAAALEELRSEMAPKEATGYETRIAELELSLRKANAALDRPVVELLKRLEEKDTELKEMMEKNAKVRNAFKMANDARKRLQEEKEQLLSGQVPAPAAAMEELRSEMAKVRDDFMKKLAVAEETIDTLRKWSKWKATHPKARATLLSQQIQEQKGLEPLQSSALEPVTENQGEGAKATEIDLLGRETARIASESALPLPKGSTWLKWGGAALEPLLAFTDVIDAAWLLQLAKVGGVVPPWQHLPPEAKLSLTQLRCSKMKFLPIAVLSYGWAGRTHPDQTGEQLRNLIPVLEAMVHSCTYGIHPKSRNERPVAWGIVWDFLSLPQRGYTGGYNAALDDRSPYELARFRNGLGGINVWYGHPYTTTFVLDLPMPTGADNSAPIDRRGWCIFERRLSSVRKHGDCCLSMSQMPPGKDVYWFSVVTSCQVGRCPPLEPEAFEVMLREGMARETAEKGTGIRFTNGKDATNICIPQYREAFLRLMSQGGQLSFIGCDWGDAEVCQLAEALTFAHKAESTCQAASLRLSQNRLTDAAVPPLVQAISSGAIPKLSFLALEDTQLTDAGLESLRDLLAGRLSALKQFGIGHQITGHGVNMIIELLADGHLKKLRTLYLQNNRRLGDSGITAISLALSQGRLPRLTTLRLDGVGMSDAGATALAGALDSSPQLTTLIVGRNELSASASLKLKALCDAQGVKVMRDPFNRL